jgi:hypothetical protein
MLYQKPVDVESSIFLTPPIGHDRMRLISALGLVTTFTTGEVSHG